jgi:hypothetical protein
MGLFRMYELHPLLHEIIHRVLVLLEFVFLAQSTVFALLTFVLSEF